MTIAEVSRMFEISADTLRYYERIGLLPAASRTCGGIRDYGVKDLGWIAFIKCMRSAGMQATLKRLDTKIEGYEDKLARAEK